MKIELRGLEVFGYHGAEDDERRLGQPFLYDVELEVGDRGVSDRLDDAVDYTEVARRSVSSRTPSDSTSWRR